MKKATFLFAFVLACNIVVAQGYFIKFDGIDGESKNAAHRGWSDIFSFNQALGIDPGATTATGATRTRRGTGSLGKIISMVKRVDKSSPKIMEALTTGRIIPSVELELSVSGNEKYRYELQNVAVTRYMVMGEGSELPMEEITISFERQKVIYTEFDDTGRRRGTIETEYN